MDNLSLLPKYKFHWLFCWLLLFAIWYFLRADGYGSSRTAFIITSIKVADLAIMVCICNYLLIPQLFYRKKYALFILCFVVLVVSGSLVKMQVLGKVMNNSFFTNWSTGWKMRIYDNIIPHFFLVFAGAAIKLMIDYAKMQNRITAMAKEKAEAELEFLKQQINPHFLFNSLNTVYFQIDKTNADARDTLHQFSEMLRYQLYETQGAVITIGKEIQYLEDYIALQKKRKDENYSINMTVAPAVEGFSIEPFLLIPFVENCFKHISHFSDQDNFIRITINYADQNLHFTAVNSTEISPVAKGGSGIGLNNVRRRLQLLYPGRHSLVIAEANNVYDLQLQVKIDEHG